ncbi:hypothetical protein J437_LFUL012991 [Ladona fulva]|uniref:SHSP domain-containing protein n=1 Tax=Ladona fulva TaxID=123851 RepID=A0A8K0P3W8_LADFU|nr:hypothetical protein J437_LFUL012991 [Ladona fulva]
MSLFQYLRSTPWDGFRSLPVMYDQDFGHVIDTSNYTAPPTPVPHHPIAHYPMGYYRPWSHLPVEKSGKSEIHNDKEGFHVVIDVQHFTPDEITVKNVDNHLVIEGKHEEKKDEHGFISRHFLRRYKLPKDVQPEAITSKLSSDGVLCILAPKAPVVEGNVRTIPIQTTGAPAVHALKPISNSAAVVTKEP